MYSHGFKSYINGITREENESKSCIDHIFIKEFKNATEEMSIPCIIKSKITDHYIIALQLILNHKLINSPNNVKTHIKYIDYNKLKEVLKDISWEDLENDNLENVTNKFINIIKNEIRRCTKIVKIKHKNKKRKNWITKELIKCINKRDKMYAELKNNPNNINLKDQYKKYSNDLNNVIKKQKVDYFKKKVEKNSSCSKNLWDITNEFCGMQKNRTNIYTVKNAKGDKINNNNEMSNMFNSFFSNIGKSLANNIVQDLEQQPVTKVQSNSIFLNPTTPFEIKKFINELKNNKSPGIDEITAKTLKEISEYIAVPLAFIINKAIVEGECPSAFKVAIIKPIHKTGSKEEITNYRPISLVNNFAKIFEKVIKFRIVNYMEKYKLLSNSQYGFRKGMNTQNAISTLVGKIYHAMDNKDKSLAVFIDLTKAFDTVCHTELLATLGNMGFRNNSIKLLKSYLTGRIQYTEINSVRSSPKTVEYGVPQGTVLGPVLFIIYINSLFDLETCGSIISYADDTALFYTDSNWQDLKSKVEKDLKNIKNYFDKKLLTLNKSKTNYLPFYLYETSAPEFQELVIDNNFNIAPVTQVKYLGIIIDSKLKWDIHINYVSNKIRKLIYRFKCLKDFLDFKQIKILYHSLVESHLVYGIMGWGGVLDSHLRELDSLQKRLLKILLNKKVTYPSNSLFKEANIMDIRSLFFCQCVLHQWRSNDQRADTIKQTRSNADQNFRVPKTNTTCGQRCFTYLGPKAYNTVPNDIKRELVFSRAKVKIKRYLLEIPREEIHNVINPKHYLNRLF